MSFRLRTLKFALALQNAFFAAFTSLLFRGKSPQDPRNILVFRTGPLGDFLFAVPSLLILRKRFPGAHITFLGLASGNRKIQKQIAAYTRGAEKHPWLDFVMPGVIDDAIIVSSLDPRSLARDIRPLIGAHKPDITFLLTHPGEMIPSLLKKLLLLRFLGVTSRVYGWHKEANYRWLRRIQFEQGRFEHKVWGPLRGLMDCPLVGQIEKSEIQFDLKIPSQVLQWAKQEWQRLGLEDKTVVAFAPGAQMRHKQWPVDNYVQVGRRLLADSNVVIAIIGTAQDQDLAAHVCGDLFLNLPIAGSQPQKRDVCAGKTLSKNEKAGDCKEKIPKWPCSEDKDISWILRRFASEQQGGERREKGILQRQGELQRPQPKAHS